VRARVLTSLSAIAAATAVAVGQTPAADPLALPRLVATERAFAAATAHLGVRDGFLTFFADDAKRVVTGASGQEVRLDPAPAALAGLPLSPLPLASRLMWEPFTGQVSADGTLGWLTGGYATISEVDPDAILNQGAYFSVWKRQPNGTWRVWLDEGVAFPSVWQDASPFRVAPEPDPGDAGRDSETLEEAERAIAAGGDAWGARLSRTVRLHRAGVMPVVGRDAALSWAAGAWQQVGFILVGQEVAGSDDLGVTVGGYDAATAAGPEHGMWVRVWRRDVTGRWRIVFETSRPA